MCSLLMPFYSLEVIWHALDATFMQKKQQPKMSQNPENIDANARLHATFLGWTDFL